MEMGKAPVDKVLVKLPSGNLAESIYFERPEKQVICVSSQLSCAVGCTFCASPSEKSKTVNLSTEDIIHQVNQMGGHTNKVMLYSFMGEGEPFLNYDNVIGAMRVLEKRPNCKISVSTAGYKIRKFALEKFSVPVKLQVSIHSCNEETRKKIIPASKSIHEIRDDIEYFHSHSDAPVELNFTLMDGINDSDEDMLLIKNMFPNEHIKISKFNNINSTIKGSKRICKCLDILDGMDVEYHETDGATKFAACGQTRGKIL